MIGTGLVIAGMSSTIGLLIVLASAHHPTGGSAANAGVVLGCVVFFVLGIILMLAGALFGA
ncbi:MAG: hypothetical protein GEU91_14080 [Rhizobiales bacterium]|nr:hypothetical protein [Hyphomicrobiales bacterium]